MLLMIDNYDSFTYMLVNYLEYLGVPVLVKKNDQISVEAIEVLNPKMIMISPGPGTPAQAGVCLSVIQRFMGTIPIFGVCLGHQAIAQALGATIIRSERIMHGKTSSIIHHGQGVFHGLPTTFRVTRYHSLVVSPDNLPASLEVTAWSQPDDDTKAEIMGIKHKSYRLEGIQFHPESVLCEQGLALLSRFVNPEY